MYKGVHFFTRALLFFHLFGADIASSALVKLDTNAAAVWVSVNTNRGSADGTAVRQHMYSITDKQFSAFYNFHPKDWKDMEEVNFEPLKSPRIVSGSNACFVVCSSINLADGKTKNQKLFVNEGFLWDYMEITSFFVG